MPRESATSISIEPNVRCLRVYPVETSKKTVADLKTVGICLSREQTIHLARVLLAVTQGWDHLEITAWLRHFRALCAPVNSNARSQKSPCATCSLQK